KAPGKQVQNAPNVADRTPFVDESTPRTASAQPRIDRCRGGNRGLTHYLCYSSSGRQGAGPEARADLEADLPRLSARDGAFTLDGRRTYLYDGELHYFRV